MSSKRVFITGATSGIGEATAKLMANKGFNLVICGRRKDRLESLKSELSKQVEVEILSFDVRDKAAVDQSIGELKKKSLVIDVLINNAGNAHGLDPIQDGSVSDWDAMIDINVKGLLYVSHAVLPLMESSPAAHIINVGSTAGKEVYPKGNVYCASKHAVDAITQGMRLDLYKQGIKVSQVCPGLVNTEFSDVRFKGDQSKAEKVYQGMRPLKAEDIADIVLYMVSAPAHVNIADLVVMPTDQASSTEVKRD